MIKFIAVASILLIQNYLSYPLCFNFKYSVVKHDNYEFVYINELNGAFKNSPGVAGSIDKVSSDKNLPKFIATKIIDHTKMKLPLLSLERFNGYRESAIDKEKRLRTNKEILQNEKNYIQKINDMLKDIDTSTLVNINPLTVTKQTNNQFIISSTSSSIKSIALPVFDNKFNFCILFYGVRYGAENCYYELLTGTSIGDSTGDSEFCLNVLFRENDNNPLEKQDFTDPQNYEFSMRSKLEQEPVLHKFKIKLEYSVKNLRI